MPQDFHLVLLIHAHQPCGNFEHVLERAYETSYLPFLEHLEAYPGVRVGLHYSGPLLTWIEVHRPEYFSRVKKLVQSGQVELVGGGFYEPILISIPPEDQREQITRLAVYLEKHFGQLPSGAWLAERVWEPQLPGALAAANVHPGGVAAMGDDMEKFGVWPGTHDHCYKNGWLADFFAALEKNSNWLKISTPGEYLATHASLGRADLPAASYMEMMEWVLPTRVRQRYHAVLNEFSARPEVLAFLRGGSWRGFFRKYAESNLLHKKMLRVSARLAAAPSRQNDSKAANELLEARDLLLRAQCNDAYWHGIFGGIYAPHLRTDAWRNLIRAESIADRQTPGALVARVELLDYDADGANELLLTSPESQALLKPNDGGTLAAFDFRPAAATLVNSILRRPEAYHTRLREAAGNPAPSAVASIHEQTRVKEPGLERFLRYDRWPRHAFRVMIFDPSRTHADYEALELHEDAGFAGGAFTIKNSDPHDVELFRADSLALHGKSEASAPKLLLIKEYSFGPAPNGCEVACEVVLKLKEPLDQPVAVGIESVINLLAPSEPDRFFETPAGHANLRFSDTLPAPVLRMEDGWQRVRIALHAPLAKEFWVAPIETVSESEEGFERVYQGSQILAVWRPGLTTQKSWSLRLVWRIESF